VADASLLKAILISSADDLGRKGIDYVYGYGSVNAYKALALMDLNQMTSITLASNEEVTIPITIPSSVSEIRIAITWTDAPATPNATSVLVNDIDSWLNDGTQVTHPWVLNPYPHIDSLQALPKRKSDHLNNIEYITLDHPAPGNYHLHVASGMISNGSQKVSVAYWMNDDELFRWDFPLINEQVEGGTKHLLVWESSPDQTGDLFLQLNNNEWQLIQSAVDLDTYFYWSCPDTFSKAKLKMKIGAVEFISDEFLISPSMKMETAFVCSDSIGLTWNSISNATSYELYTMGDQYLKKISATNDTLIVLPKSSNDFFAISPVSNGVTGIKSTTINYTQQGVLCYLNLFSAERYSTTQTRVQLQVSSRYQVDHITIFRITNGNTDVFKNITLGNSLFFDFYDTDLQPGTMIYYAEIVLQSGINILSDRIEITIEEKGKAIIFPNPVTSDSDLSILSGGGGVTFRILDLFGRILVEKELVLVADAIDVIHLPAGVYIYHLISQGTITDTGKFIKY
jgi:hypothetical protein